jgi:hypothetical protein
MLASRSAFKPPAQRGVRFTGASPGEEPFDADVLVEIRPMDAFAFADQPPVVAFREGAMR